MSHIDSTHAKLLRPGTTPNVSKMHNYSIHVLKRDVIDMGQGNPQKRLHKDLEKLLTWKGASGNEYNDDLSKLGNKTAADYLNYFTGIQAKEETTRLLEQQGRFTLTAAFMAAADPYRDMDAKPVVMVPSDMWGVINIQLKGLGIKTISYDVFHPNPAQAIRESEENCSDIERTMLCCKYTCSPNNPNGFLYTPEIFSEISEDNIKSSAQQKDNDLPPTVLMVDAPYINACPHNPSEGSHILHTGMDAVYGHSIILNSLAKTHNMCKKGAAIVYSDDEVLLQAFDKYSSSIGGNSYSDDFMAQITKALSPEYYDKWEKEFQETYDLYVQNLEITKKLFGSRMKSLGPNMTGLIEISEEVLGKEAIYFDGTRHRIMDGDDMVEFLNNREGVGVTMSFNGMTKEGNLSMRIANKNTQRHQEGLQCALDGERELINGLS